MVDKIISIENPAKLSIDTGRLKIKSITNQQEGYVACVDIAVVIISNPQVTLTSAVVTEITNNQGIILFTNDKYMPTSFCFSNVGNNLGSKRPWQQLTMPKEDAEKAWQQVIKSKILGQGLFLSGNKTKNSSLINSLVTYVELGDKTNIEAKSAKIYWQDYFLLFNKVQNREKQGASDMVNSCLNYGYTVLRAIVARSLASLGLQLSFGIGHYRQDNPFNLVEDFIEPYRYLIDQIVYEELNKEELLEDTQSFLVLDSKMKKILISRIYHLTVNLNHKEYRIQQAIHVTNQSFCNFLEKKVKNLILPNLEFKGNKADVENNFIII